MISLVRLSANFLRLFFLNFFLLFFLLNVSLTSLSKERSADVHLSFFSFKYPVSATLLPSLLCDDWPDGAQFSLFLKCRLVKASFLAIVARREIPTKGPITASLLVLTSVRFRQFGNPPCSKKLINKMHRLVPISNWPTEQGWINALVTACRFQCSVRIQAL